MFSLFLLLTLSSDKYYKLLQVALRRQQAQEESEARELGLQLQYNAGSCNTASVLPAAAGAGATPAGSPPPHPAHVASPAGLAIPAAAAAAAAAAAVHIQTQLQQQPADCALLPRKRSQDEYRQSKVEKTDAAGKLTILLCSLKRDLSSFFFFFENPLFYKKYNITIIKISYDTLYVLKSNVTTVTLLCRSKVSLIPDLSAKHSPTHIRVGRK